MAPLVQVEVQLLLMDGWDTLFKMQRFIETRHSCVYVRGGRGPQPEITHTRMLEDTRSTSYMSPLTFQLKLDSRVVERFFFRRY